jgi:hypothetical protein
VDGIEEPSDAEIEDGSLLDANPFPWENFRDFTTKKASDVCLYCETGGGIFEGVCARENRHLLFATHPPPPLDSPTALFQPCSKSNTGVSVRAFYFLVSHQPIGL